MDPEIWGPPAWKFIHLLSLNYPNKPSFEDKYNYKEFILSLQKVLPCETCARHFKKNIENSDFEKILKSRESLFEWFVDVHNSINKQNKKKEWSYGKVYNHLKVQNNYNYKKYFLFISILILFIIIIYKIIK
jgi:hypothetical protein